VGEGEGEHFDHTGALGGQSESLPHAARRHACSVPHDRPLICDQVAGGAEEGEGVFEEAGEGGDSSADYQVVGLPVSRVFAGGFGAGVEDGDVGEAQLLHGQLEEAGAFADGFEEGEVGVGAGDGEDEAGEAAAGADVGDALGGGNVPNEQGGEGVKEVLDGCFGGVGDGGEAGAGVVGDEELVVVGVGVQLPGGDGEAEEGCGGEEGGGEGIGRV